MYHWQDNDLNEYVDIQYGQDLGSSKMDLTKFDALPFSYALIHVHKILKWSIKQDGHV